ncbi:hypothetical protein ES703_66340 [subsurface metagenome]
MTEEEIEKRKKEISKMCHYEMAYLWRFAPAGDPLFDNTLPLADCFNKRFQELGGMTTDLSKKIGWKKRR